MSTLASDARVISLVEAATRGVFGLVYAAEQGQDVVVERRGEPVAAVISVQQLIRIRQLEDDSRDAVLLVARLATDEGVRTGLDEAIEALGFVRSELEAELDADLGSDQASA